MQCHHYGDGAAVSRMNRLSLLDWFYHVPDPVSCEEDHQRYCHEDLVGLSLPELERELGRMHLRALIEEVPDPWLAERERALLEAIRQASPGSPGQHAEYRTRRMRHRTAAQRGAHVDSRR